MTDRTRLRRVIVEVTLQKPGTEMQARDIIQDVLERHGERSKLWRDNVQFIATKGYEQVQRAKRS